MLQKPLLSLAIKLCGRNLSNFVKISLISLQRSPEGIVAFVSSMCGRMINLVRGGYDEDY